MKSIKLIKTQHTILVILSLILFVRAFGLLKFHQPAVGDGIHSDRQVIKVKINYFKGDTVSDIVPALDLGGHFELVQRILEKVSWIFSTTLDFSHSFRAPPTFFLPI